MQTGYTWQRQRGRSDGSGRNL